MNVALMTLMMAGVAMLCNVTTALTTGESMQNDSVASLYNANRTAKYRAFNCRRSGCQNNGICIPIFKTQKCICPTNFTGLYCEKNLNGFNFLSKVLMLTKSMEKSSIQKNNTLSGWGLSKFFKQLFDL
ncbi:unnamed protein product [Owenia fusiformis]|uniref:Uncharacterized protein n=1 Tax=Owenia fusiformis TaxID=6347 RepID=A0A8J1U8P7_OWEFU|nr:unnamed protein product [Owenia fusiformis]